MKQGTSFQGFVPVRNDPTHAAEMGSQVLFGETFQVLETYGSWIRISLDFDGFEGWVERSSIHMMPGDIQGDTGAEGNYRIAVMPSVAVRDQTNDRPLILPAGSIWNSSADKVITTGGKRFELLSEEGWVIPGKETNPEEIGKLLLSVPGLHGGRCGFGFDGPGLVQMLCRSLGLSLPRHCTGQAETGETINFIHEAVKGDLAFFDNQEGEIIHSGMVLGDGTVLHARDQVRIDKLDQQGIYCAEEGEYTHNLRIIKRLRKEAK